MATLNANYQTMLDIANMPKNKDVKSMVNMLAQYNPMLADAAAIPCNMGVQHEHSVVTGLPKAFWGRYYQGTPNTKGQRQQVKDTPGWLESANEVDTRLIDVLEKAQEKASLMEQEASLHIEAMSQAAARSLWYQDISDDPASIVGFGPRFNSLSAENGSQIINAGGTGGDNTSIWMITWDPMTAFMIYPKHGKVGIQTKMFDNWPATDANGDKYSVYREVFTWHLGLALKDWRYVARIANIDTSNLRLGSISEGTAADEFALFRTGSNRSANLVDLMNSMYYRHEGRRMMRGKTCIYANRTILEFLEAQARNLPRNLYLNYDNVGVNQSKVLTFRGIPIKETDSLLNSEARVQ